MKRRALVLVTFGTSEPGEREVLARFEADARQRFPETPVRWAYTSRRIRQRAADQGIWLDSPQMALSRLAEEGFAEAAVQSLHVIPGFEFHDLARTCSAFSDVAKALARITVGRPLLDSDRDFLRVAEALTAAAPPGRLPDEAVVLVGHGTKHPANAAYAALAWHCQRRDQLFLVGTIDHLPDPDMVASDLAARGVKRAHLVPFMSVAGAHARQDMAGPDPASWQSRLTAAGFEIAPWLRGLAENESLRRIWLDHLAEAAARLG